MECGALPPLSSSIPLGPIPFHLSTKITPVPVAFIALNLIDLL